MTTTKEHTMTTTTDTSIRIGDRATYQIGSDRYGMVVIDVQRNGRTIVAVTTQAFASWANYDGCDLTAEDIEAGTFSLHGIAWAIRSTIAREVADGRPNDPRVTFTLRADGTLRSKGHGTGRLYVGQATTELDPSF